MASRRFAANTLLIRSTIENIYIDLTDLSPSPLTDLSSADSVTAYVYNSSGVQIESLSPTIDLMNVGILIDTTTLLFAGIAEVQDITVTATGGTWKALYKGIETQPLAFDITDSDLQTALQTLHLETISVSVSLSGSDYTITFPTATNYNPAEFEVTDIDLSGTSHDVAVVTTQTNVAPRYVFVPEVVYNIYIAVAISSETIWAGPYTFKVDAP